MELQEIHERTAWNKLLLSQPAQAGLHAQAGIFLQSLEWGEFQKAVGRKVYRLVNSAQSTVHGIAQVIELPLPFGKKYWFIPRGALIAGLVEEARKRGALFVRFESTHGTMPHGTVKTKPVSPTQTLLVDLSRSEEELLAAMHEKTRYNIRLALRKGIICQAAGDHKSDDRHFCGRMIQREFEEFWKLLQETAKRDKFHTHPRGYYEKMLSICHPAERSDEGSRTNVRGSHSREILHSVQNDKFFVRLWLAYSGATPLAAAIVGYFGDTATYLHGASSYEHRSLMGPYALHWNIMQEAKKAGCRVYDFWGTQSSAQLSACLPARQVHGSQKSWAGITRFKTGFGGTIIDYPGTFDLPLNQFRYIVYRLGRRMRP